MALDSRPPRTIIVPVPAVLLMHEMNLPVASDDRKMFKNAHKITTCAIALKFFCDFYDFLCFLTKLLKPNLTHPDSLMWFWGKYFWKSWLFGTKCVPALVKLVDFCDILYFYFFQKNHKIRSLYLCGKGTESHFFRKFTKFWKLKSGTNNSAVLKTLPWVGPFNR